MSKQLIPTVPLLLQRGLRLWVLKASWLSVMRISATTGLSAMTACGSTFPHRSANFPTCVSK